MTSKASPGPVESNPDLRDGHPERLLVACRGNNDVSHHRVQDGRGVNDHNVILFQIL